MHRAILCAFGCTKQSPARLVRRLFPRVLCANHPPGYPEERPSFKLSPSQPIFQAIRGNVHSLSHLGETLPTNKLAEAHLPSHPVDLLPILREILQNNPAFKSIIITRPTHPESPHAESEYPAKVSPPYPNTPH